MSIIQKLNQNPSSIRNKEKVVREQKVTFSHLSLNPRTNSNYDLMADIKDTIITYTVSYAIRLITPAINLTRQTCIKTAFMICFSFELY